MTPAQCRAARAMLGWSQEKLGTMAGGLSFQAVSAFERDMPGRMSEETVLSIEEVFVNEGVFFEENSAWSCVGLMKK